MLTRPGLVVPNQVATTDVVSETVFSVFCGSLAAMLNVPMLEP